MIDERTREKLERWGALDPIEPIMPPDTARPHPDELPPLPAIATADRLDALRVYTEHEPYRPRCPRCRRLYYPAARIQQGIETGCYHCSSLTRAILDAELERRWQLAMAFDLRKYDDR